MARDIAIFETAAPSRWRRYVRISDAGDDKRKITCDGCSFREVHKFPRPGVGHPLTRDLVREAVEKRARAHAAKCGGSVARPGACGR